jgi:hypothetical protein
LNSCSRSEAHPVSALALASQSAASAARSKWSGLSLAVGTRDATPMLTVSVPAGLATLLTMFKASTALPIRSALAIASSGFTPGRTITNSSP